jgi:hypothetical protein
MFSLQTPFHVSARQILLTGLFTVLCTLSAQTTPASPAYSAASLQGNYVLTESGTNLQSQANYAGVSVLNLDGSGNVNGTAYLVAGAFAASGNTVTGSYTVGSDGWGTMALVAPALDGSGNMNLSSYSILLTSNGIVVGRTDNGIFAQASLVSQAKATFSTTNANGGFVFMQNGYSANGPVAMLGRLVFDGFGNVTGTANYQTFGSSFSGAVNGTYAINPDGSGNLALTLSTNAADGTVVSSTMNYSVVMIDKTGKAAAISSDPGTTAIANILTR